MRHFHRSYLKANKISKSEGTRKVEHAYYFWKCADADDRKLSKSVHAYRNGDETLRLQDTSAPRHFDTDQWICVIDRSHCANDESVDRAWQLPCAIGRSRMTQIHWSYSEGTGSASILLCFWFWFWQIIHSPPREWDESRECCSRCDEQSR